MRKILLLAGLFGAAALAACGDTNVPGGNDLISFSASRRDTAVVEGASANPGARQISLTGRFVAPNGCQELAPNVESDGMDLRFTVTATAQSGTCTIPGGYFTYGAVIGNYAPGTYRLRIFHRDTRGTRTAFDGSITLAF
jgi:hypothetical protein